MSEKSGMNSALSPNVQTHLDVGEFVVWRSKPTISPVARSRKLAINLAIILTVPNVLMVIVMLIFEGNEIYLSNVVSGSILTIVMILSAALIFFECLRLMQWLFLRRISYLATNKRYVQLTFEKISNQIDLSAIHRPHLSGMPKSAPSFYRAIVRILNPAPYVVLVPKELSERGAFNGAKTLSVRGCEDPEHALESLQNAWEAAQ